MVDKNRGEQTVHSLIEDHTSVLKKVAGLSTQITAMAQLIGTCMQQGGKILLMGNGGSAADCQHIAAEFVGRFQEERKALPAIALTTDSSVLTSIANDYGFESVFVRQIDALCCPEDVVIGISTSGRSTNVTAALEKANELGAVTMGFTGSEKAPVNEMAQYNLKIPSKNTARIQEMHILCAHIICEMVEQTIIERK